MLKSKVFVLQNVADLFGMVWIFSFDLWKLPINSFCYKIYVSPPITNRVQENLMKDLRNKFPEVFSEGLRRCTKTKENFEVKENVKPIFKPKRNSAVSVWEPINKELEWLENLGVLSKVEYLDWLAPTLYVKKDHKIHICTDYSTGLNGSLKLQTYLLLSSEDIFAKFNGRKVFSKLNLSDVYLLVQVNEEYLKLLTINTYKGLYKFNPLLFGVKIVPHIFQQIMVTMLAGLDFAIAYLNKALIKSKNHRQQWSH